MKKPEKKQPKKKQPVQPEPAAGERSARAVVRFLRISPRKVRLVLDTIRRKKTGDAFRILFAQQKKAARMTEKLLKSAVANAKVLGLDENRLYVAKIYADAGPMMKRIMARSMGRTDRLVKRMTHISIVVAEGAHGWKAPAFVGSAEEHEGSSKGKSATKHGGSAAQFGGKKSVAGKKTAGSAA